MNSRERLLTVLRGGIPDCVPVAPDFSNMIPARLTGKPFWDLYLYNDPPIWEAYIACARYFDIDAVMDGYFPLTLPEEACDEGWEDYIVFRSADRIVTQAGRKKAAGWSGRRLSRSTMLPIRLPITSPQPKSACRPSPSAGNQLRIASRWTKGRRG